MTDQRYVFIYRNKDETTSISFDGEITIEELCEKLTTFVRACGFSEKTVIDYNLGEDDA